MVEVYPCHEECFYYGVFGDVEGCDASGFHERMEPGQECPYPNHRSICQHIGTFSFLELCAALEGTPTIDTKTGEPGDFTKLLISLDTNPPYSR